MNVEPVVLTAPENALSDIIFRESADASLVMLGFELPDSEQYKAWAEHLSALMPPDPDVVLVHGTGKEDIFC